MCNTLRSMVLVICTHKYTIIILEIFTCSLTVGLTQNVVCDTGWTEHSGMCFFFKEDIKVGWEQAKSYCNQQNNSYLVSVTDDNVNQFLFNNKQVGKEHWVGLKPFNNDAWGWNDGSVDWNINWFHGLPNGDEACARFTGTDWFYPYDCQTISRFICERDTEPSQNETWEEYEQHWYTQYELSYSQSTAAKHCISVGGYLVRLTTQSERQFVSDNFDTNDGAWVGLTRFVWEDGSGYEWNAWDKGYPEDTKCVALGKGGNNIEWKSKGCATQLNFICMQAVSRTPSTTVSISTATTANTFVKISTTSSSPVEYLTEQSQTHNTHILPTLTQEVRNDSTTGRPNDVSEPTSNIGTGKNNVNATAVSGLDTKQEINVLWNVLYVIYTLVGTMLVTDLVLLVIYLKLKNKSESEFDKISSTNDDETAITVTSPDPTVGHSPTVQKSTFPIYAVLNKPSSMQKQGQAKVRNTPITGVDETQYPEILVHKTDSPTHDNANFPVYAVPNKRKPRDMDI